MRSYLLLPVFALISYRDCFLSPQLCFKFLENRDHALTSCRREGRTSAGPLHLLSEFLLTRVTTGRRGHLRRWKGERNVRQSLCELISASSSQNTLDPMTSDNLEMVRNFKASLQRDLRSCMLRDFYFDLKFALNICKTCFYGSAIIGNLFWYGLIFKNTS